jgi:hypothetical protein
MTTIINADNGVSSGSAGLKSSADSSGVLALQTNGTTGITVGTDQSILMTGAPSIGGAGYGMGMGFRNRIINGAMVIAQRATTATANLTTAASGLFIADRFRAVITAGTGVFTFAQDSSLYPTGFTYSLKSTVTTAYTVTGTDRYEISQLIEGYNIADLSWGTASAQTITVSFWVRSSLTGTFGGVVQNANADYNYPFSYTISVANTWEQKTITITGPTTGTWATDNTQGLKVVWSLGCGSTRLGTAGAWSATRYEGVTGQTQLIATNGATFNITGVQVEKGSTATAFDYRPYGTELALCESYFQKTTIAGRRSGGFWIPENLASSNSMRGTYQYPVTMRAAPTGTITQDYLDGGYAGKSYTFDDGIGSGLSKDAAVLFTDAYFVGGGGNYGSFVLTIALTAEL